MRLIDEIKNLRELEQQAEPDWFRGDAGNIYCKKSPERYPLLMPYGINASASEVKLAVDLRNLAHDMLRVLECFREGDAALLEDVVHIETEMAKFSAGFGDIAESHQRLIDALSRAQKAAALMEQEAREG